MGEGERDEQAAKDILRSNVLETPDQAAAAWRILITEGASLNAKHKVKRIGPHCLKS